MYGQGEKQGRPDDELNQSHDHGDAQKERDDLTAGKIGQPGHVESLAAEPAGGEQGGDGEGGENEMEIAQQGARQQHRR